jgi:CHAT domain-containing protein
MSIAELKQALCDENLTFAEKYARLRLAAPQLSAEEVEELSLALKRYSDTRRNALKPDPHTGVLTFLLGKHAQHNRYIAFGYAHLIYGARYNVNSNFYAAYRHLQRAMSCFESANNPYGWASTAISYNMAAFNVRRTEAIMTNFERAKNIFIERQDYELLSLLYGNMLPIYLALGHRDEKFIQAYLALSREPSLSILRRARILDNVGYWYTQHGNEYEAAAYHRQACDLLETCENLSHRQAYLNACLNLVESLQRTGRIQEAMRYLHIARTCLPAEPTPELRRVYAPFAYNQAACLRALNRPFEAIQAIHSHLEIYRSESADYYHAYIHRELGATYAELGQYDHALAAFQKALDALNPNDEINRNRLRLMRLAVQLRRYTDSAPPTPERCADLQTEAADLQYQLRDDALHGAEAKLLLARAYALSDLSSALHYAETAVQAACAVAILPLQYEAYLTLGKLQVQSGNLEAAVHNLQAAVACIEAMQRDMAIPFRTRFLSDKGEALHHLVQLYIQQGDYGNAFDAIERSKASAFLSLVIGEDSLHISQDAATAPLIEEIEQLRAQLYAAEVGERLPSTEALAKRERLKQLTEQLYSAMQVQHGRDPRQVLAWQAIQAHLPSDGLLIAFYEDSEQYSLFWFDANSPTPNYARLACDAQTVADLLERIRFETESVNFILAGYPADDPPEKTLAVAAADPNLARRQQRFARHMEKAFETLLAPLAEQLSRYTQLFIVPYGDLHNAPLHLLRVPAIAEQPAHYLIERYTVTILPTANLVVPRLTKAPSSAFVVWDDRSWSAQRAFRHAAQTANAVCAAMPACTTVHVEAVAPENVFTLHNADVIHLIAHAEYDPSYPTEACIWLGKRALEMAQILQQHLNGAIVFLNSCRIGQLHMERAHGKRAAGDDAIGLGRTFLYAGASALVSSLWDIFDGFTLPLIAPFYAALQAGDSCAAALRKAQLTFRDQFRTPQGELHPIVWGAFQSIGR